MHTTEEITSSCGKPRVGLIAGQGDLPRRLIARWREQGVSPIVVGLKGITPDSLSDLTDDVTFFAIGQAGHILEHLKEQGAQSVVLAGALKRPNFWALRTDSYGFGILLRLLSRLVLRRMGDDSLLKFIRHEIEKFGLTLIGAHEVLPDILSPAGVLGTVSPTEGERIRIEPCFQGHFPGNPVMPGVLIVEAMAQTAGVLVVHSLGQSGRNKMVYFMTIDGAKFRKPVVPGDSMHIHVQCLKSRGNVWKFRGEAKVDGVLCAEAEYSAMIFDAPDK